VSVPLRVVLCADDYGLTDGVSRGILHLADAGRISATGAMTNMPGWPALAPALRERDKLVAAGLHLNLTAGAPLRPMPGLAPSGRFPALGAVVRGALSRRLPLDEIRAEIERQLDSFERAFGAPPAFVDGHQHVHALPGIREALIDALLARGYARRPWLRDPSDRMGAILARRVSAAKALAVAALSAGFATSARQAGFGTNRGFSGFSPLDAAADPARVMESAFLRLGPAPVVMCHPGHADEALRRLDPAVESRERELAYLASEAFGRLVEERRISLTARPESAREQAA
jgi:predicted glycoside hydrolase/deacetylase ChbG (UPF0249 family)